MIYIISILEQISRSKTRFAIFFLYFKQKSNDSDEIQHETKRKQCVSSSETQLPSTDSNDHRMSVVIQNPVFDLVNENESNVESIITDCDLPADLKNN